MNTLNKLKYKKELLQLQVKLVKLQRHIIKFNHRILIIFEGRDASGKDGVIKRITEHLSPRESRVVALGKPTERENRAWYFQRYTSHLPVDAEMVLFNRSWYNRAGVERVMGYCTKTEYEKFINTVNDFEDLLIRSGVNVLKYYLDISKEEQERRLSDRKKDPLKQWKVSPVDQVAIKKWDAYSKTRNEMLERTNTKLSPWIIVKADNKRNTRINIIKDILSRVECPERDKHLSLPDADIIFKYKTSLLKNGVISP
jgi:polyphosphate kinase